jgi:hypothetical protein
MNEIIGGWRKLRNEEINNLCSSPNVIKTIKSMKIRWGGHIAHMGRGEMHVGFW